MAISRMQMNRQLYAGGGIMDVTPRENFGLGSKLKKFVRKVIPNEIADVAVKAAPFVAPFNPLIAAGMAGLGGFDQTGSISKSLRSGALTYGLGNLARVVGGGGFQGGLKSPEITGKGFGSYFSSPFTPGQQLFGGMPKSAPVVSDAGFDQSLIVPPGAGDPAQFLTDAATTSFEQAATPKTYSGLLKQLVSPEATLGQRTQAIKELGGKALKGIYTKQEDGKTVLDKNALFSTIAGVGSYIEAKKLLDDAGEDTEGYTEEMYEADKAKYMEKYEELLNPDQFYATGGRVKLETGGIPSIMLAKKEYNFMDLIDKEGEDEYYEKKAEELDRKYNPERYKQILPKEKPMDKYMLDAVMSEKGMRTLSEETRDDAMKMYAEKAYKKGQISEDEYREIMGFKVGGRVGYKIGSDGSSTGSFGANRYASELVESADSLLNEGDILMTDAEKLIASGKYPSEEELKEIQKKYDKLVNKEERETNKFSNDSLTDEELGDAFPYFLEKEKQINKKTEDSNTRADKIGLESLDVSDITRSPNFREWYSLWEKGDPKADKHPQAEYFEDLIFNVDRKKYIKTKYPDIKMADGGRVGYKIGSKPKEDEEGIMSVKMEMEDEDKENMMMADAPGITFTTSEKSYLFKTLAGQGGSDRSFTMPQLYGILNNPNSDKNIDDAKALKSFLKIKGFKRW
jgi:hypothetical protein